MIRQLCQAAALSGTLLISGCGVFFGDDGVFRDRGSDYLKAERFPPMEVPPGVDERVLGQLYEVPNTAAAEDNYPEEFEAPRPEALSTSLDSESVKIQSLGDDSWIFVAAAPSEIWPRVRNFLSDNGLEVDRTDAPQGLIESAWLNFQDSPDSRDRYRLRIEHGVHPDTAEIHVTHYSIARDAELPETVDWPEQSSSAERETWMIQELARGLAREMGSASASLLAQTIGGGEKVAMETEAGEPVLRMQLQRERAWASLNHALEQDGLHIIDSDAEAGLVYIDDSEPEDSTGFFSSWFSGDDPAAGSLSEVLAKVRLADTPENRRLFPAEALDNGTGDAEDVPGYLVLITENGGGVDVRLRRASGETLELVEARELLSTVRRNLI